MLAEQLYTLTRRTTTAIDPRLSVEGLISNDAGRGRMEVMILIAGCHREPCTFVLSIERANVHRQLTQKLVSALATHTLAHREPARGGFDD